MEGLIFPIIMLAVTLLGGGLLLIVLKHSKPKHKGGGESLAIQCEDLAFILSTHVINSSEAVYTCNPVLRGKDRKDL